MQTSKVIHSVSCHAEGEVGDVIVGGVAVPPGDNIWQQSRYIAEHGELRNFMLNEPRGGVFRHVNLLVPPSNPAADMAWIIMEPEDTPPMSGSNSLCVATVLLETGILPMQEPITELTLEAPGGLIKVQAHCEAGKVTSVRTFNHPSFVSAMAQPLEVSGLGTLSVDIAYGGDSFVMVDAQALGLALSPEEGRDIADIGARISAAANEQLSFVHPENNDWQHISFCQLTLPVTIEDGIKTGKSAVVIQPGKIDRSPCGTGCSARLALLHARGEIAVGESYIGTSIIDSVFHCRIEQQTKLGEYDAILPSLEGRAWITGTHQHMLSPADPWPMGYKITDTWPQKR